MNKKIREIFRKGAIILSLIIGTFNGIIIKEYEKGIDKLNIQIKAYIDILENME